MKRMDGIWRGSNEAKIKSGKTRCQSEKHTQTTRDRRSTQNEEERWTRPIKSEGQLAWQEEDKKKKGEGEKEKEVSAEDHKLIEFKTVEASTRQACDKNEEKKTKNKTNTKRRQGKGEEN
jgi:hypothetical protein